MPALPSLMVTSEIDTAPATGAASSLVMVPSACASLMVAPLVALARLTKNVSSGSKVVSPLRVTLTCAVFTPAAKLTVPEAAT